MNELFVRVYLDEDVNVLVAKYLRLQDFRVLTVTEAKRKGNSDAEQLEYAVLSGYAILTHNRNDYEKLADEYFTNGKAHRGIIISVRRPSNEIATRLIEVLNKYAVDEMMNQIIYI